VKTIYFIILTALLVITIGVYVNVKKPLEKKMMQTVEKAVQGG